MNRRLVFGFCTGGFAVLCIAAVLFLHAFMTVPEPIHYITFQSADRINEDGSLTPCTLDEHGTVTGMENGAVYRFCTTVEDIPTDGYLLLETAGAAFTIRMDGEAVLQSTGTASYGMQTMGVGQVHVPFPPGVERCDLEIDYQVLDAENALYPPLARFTSLWLTDGANIAYANLYGIPAGCFTLVFVCVCGLFLLGLAQGRPDYTLLVLVLATGMLSIYQISRGYGYYFLPELLNDFFTWHGFSLLSPLLLLVWLLLGRRRGTWRQLGWSVLTAGVVVLCIYLASLVRGGYTAGYINDMFVTLFQYGDYSRPVYWMTVFLVADSAVIAVLGVLRDFARVQTDAQTLALKNELTANSYRAAEEKLRQNTAMRHEWKNQVATLHLLQQKGDLEELGHRLEELDTQLDKLAPQQYTKHFTINTILQNAAARANDLGVSFHAAALVPAELSIPDGDLCSLLFNMLDNALEATSQVSPPQTREVECMIKVTQGYLAIKCENSYTGGLSLDEWGRLQTTKADQDSHGFGLAQMRSITKKYGSILDISYTDDHFTVQTALKIR